MKWRRAGAAVVVACLAALALVAMGVFPQGALRAAVETRLRAALGPTTRLGGLHVVPGSLRAEFWDLETVSSPISVSVPHGEISLRPRTLLGRGIFLRSLTLDRPVIKVARAEAEPKAQAPTAPPRLAIEALAIHSGAVRYDAGPAGVVESRDIEIEGSIGAGSLVLSAPRISLGRDGKDIDVGSLRTTLTVSSALAARVDAFRFERGASHIVATGDIGPLAAPAPRLSVDADLALDGLADLASVDGLSGTATAHVTTEGSLDAVAGTASLRQVSWGGATIDEANVKARQEGDRTTAEIEASAFGGNVRTTTALAHGRVDGTLDLDRIALKRLPASVSLPRDLDGDISARVRFAGPWDGRVRVNGTLTSSASFNGPLSARVDIAGAVFPADRRADLSFDASLDASADGTLRRASVTTTGTAAGPWPPAVNGSFTVDALAAVGDEPRPLVASGTFGADPKGSRFTGSGTFLGGSFEADAAVAGRRIERSSLKASELRLDQLDARLEGTAALDISAAGATATPDLDARVEIVRAKALAADLGDVRATVAGSSRTAVWTLGIPALALQGQGDVRGGAAGELTGTLAWTKTRLAAFGAMESAPKDLSGETSGTARLRVPLAKPMDAELSARVESIEAATPRWSGRAAAPFDVSYRAGDAEVRDLKLVGAGFEAAVTADYGHGAARAATAEASVLVDLAALKPAIEGLSGNVRALLRVDGTAKLPKTSGRIDLSRIVVDRPSMPRFEIAEAPVTIADNAATVSDLAISLPGGAIVASGVVPLAAWLPRARQDPARPSAEERAHLTAKWNGLAAGELLARLRPTSESKLTAALSGELTVEGGLARLAEVVATLRSAETAFAVGDVAGSVGPFEVRLADGRAHTEGIEVAAQGSSLKIAGGGDVAARTLDLAGRGALDLRVLSPVLADAALTGIADIDARVSGTFDSPQARGRLKIDGATARVRVLAQSLTDISAEAVFDGTEVRLERASAALGGGALSAQGSARLAKTAVDKVDVTIRGTDLGLRYPEGLRSRLDANLRLTGRPGAFLLSGDVKARRGVYDRDFQTSSFLAQSAIADSALLRSVALRLELATEAPIRVRNDTARLEAGGRLFILGDMQSPSPYGQLDIVAPGGDLTFQGARYLITRGTVSYGGTWDPSIDMEVRRQVKVRRALVPGDYTAVVVAKGTTTEITRELLQLALGGNTGSGDTLRFSAEGPSALEPRDVASLLLTGYSGSEVRGARLAGEQTGTLLVSQLTRKLERGLPFERITIRPELVANETQPDARFTFGAPLVEGADLTYSQSLTVPEDRLIQLEVRPVRTLALNVKREYNRDVDNNLVTVGAGQRIEWGGSRGARSKAAIEERVELASVRIEGAPDVESEKAGRAALRSRPGKSVTTWNVQDDDDRLREAFLRRGFLDAEVSSRIEGRDAVFTVRPGRGYVWRVEGVTPAPQVDDAVRAGLFEEESLDKGRAAILETLRKRGHLRAEVTSSARDEGDRRLLLFTVRPGPKLKLEGVSFAGATAIGQDVLLAAAGGPGALVTKPEKARQRVQAAYAEAHYFRARIGAPEILETTGRVKINVPVEEGAPARIVDVAFEGATREAAELRAVVRVEPGSLYDETQLLASVDALRDDYYHLGFAAARVYATHEDKAEGIALTFHVTEGKKLTVGSVEITGLTRVRPSLARSQIDLKPGDPVDPKRLARAERKLLSLGVFSRVASRYSDDESSLVTFEVQERPRFGAGYDARFNGQEKASALVDADVRNLLGRGLGIGGRYRRSRDVGEIRGTVSAPAILGTGSLTGSVFREEESNFGEGETGVTRLQRGFQLQQSAALSSRTTLLYGYRFSRSRVTSPLLPFPSNQSVAALTVSAIRDTRDDVLDARHGSFVSANLTISPALIGSDENFVKGLVQGFVSTPIGARATWAQGYRLGLAHVFGGEPLVSSEGFRAGGANTIRGLKPDALRGDIFGAQALILVNQELRVRTAAGIGAVAFYDGGEVRDTPKGLGKDWRHSLGAGLRWTSPFGLLRLDLGFPLNRKEGEKSWQWFFSLGQAF